MTTGANAIAPLRVLRSSSRAALRRHANNCCGVSPCRRATSQTVVPSAWLSATICAFCSAVHERRRPAPVNTSSRRTGSVLDLSKSSVSDMCLTPLVTNGATLPDQKPLMGTVKEHRLPRIRSRSFSTDHALGSGGLEPAVGWPGWQPWEREAWAAYGLTFAIMVTTLCVRMPTY